MKIIILPGNSVINKVWAENLKKSISGKNSIEDVFIQNYSHWESEEEIINLEKEKEKLLKTIFAIKDSKYIIVAKSAGTLLCLNVINRIEKKPEKIILLGIPVRWAKDNGFFLKNTLQEICSQLTVIQNIKDPVAHISDTEEFLRECGVFKEIDFKKMLEDTHNYDQSEGAFDIINKIIKNIM
jgi:hypothetical protein